MKRNIIDSQNKKKQFATIKARYSLAVVGECLRAQISEAERQGEMLFKGLLAEVFELWI